MSSRLLAAACGFAAAWSPVASAAESCVTPDRNQLVACALVHSAELEVALAEVKAAAGRGESGRLLLPSNPVLAVSLASRTSSTDRALNWYLTLSQELEIAGQRELRLQVASAQQEAEQQHLRHVRAEVIERAWNTYFRVLAARERMQLAQRVETVTEGVAATVRAMATGGLSPEVDVDVAEAAALRAAQDRIGAETTLAARSAALAALVASSPSVSVRPEGTLEPLEVGSPESDPSERAELQFTKAVRHAAQRRTEALRRERIPNPSITLFAQSDGFREQVWGAGLGMPVPLPHPLGRTRAGEIEESLALEQKADAELAIVRRALELDLREATAQFEGATATRRLHTPERSARAWTKLEAIAVQVKAGRLGARDAVVTQQVLLEQLKADLDAREALCLASVRLARARGLLGLEGAAP